MAEFIMRWFTPPSPKPERQPERQQPAKKKVVSPVAAGIARARTRTRYAGAMARRRQNDETELVKKKLLGQ